MEGNYLGKSRHNFFISKRCWQCIQELSLELGLNHSGVIELAVREMFVKYRGPIRPIAYDWERKRE